MLVGMSVDGIGTLATALMIMAVRPKGFPVSRAHLAHFSASCLLATLPKQKSQSNLGTAAHLRLDPVEAPEPEDLASAKLPLGVINLFLPLGQLLVRHLVLPGPVPCFLQALELAGGNGGDDLGGQRQGTAGRVGRQSSPGLFRVGTLLGPRRDPDCPSPSDNGLGRCLCLSTPGTGHHFLVPESTMHGSLLPGAKSILQRESQPLSSGGFCFLCLIKESCPWGAERGVFPRGAQ